MANQIKTTILLALLTAVILWIGHLFGGQQGMIIALIFAGAMNFFSYWYSDKIVLKMYRAKEVTPQESPKLFEIVSSLANKANLPMPKLFIIPSKTPNAFATGRNPEHAVVAVTDGLLRLMDIDEITGVIAHELAHVKNRDILIGSIAATMAGAIMLLATIARWSAIFGGMSGDDDEGGLGIIGLIVMAIIAPIAAMIIQMAISRSREYLADSTGSQIAQNPNGLASALEKLGTYNKRIPMKANPSTAHMFIVNPLTGKSLMNLFSTHPPIEERVARLRGEIAPKNQSGKSGDSQAKNAKAFWNGLSG